MGLGEFIGDSGASSATSNLPRGPAERAPDDDGSFKRPVRRSDNYMDQPPSRSEGDGNWRRGAPGAGPSSGFGSSDGGGGRDNYNSNRGGGFDRDSRDRGSSGGFDSRGTGGYNRGNYSEGNSGGDTRPPSGDNWRTSNNSRENVPSAPSPAGERPRFQLKARTLPMPASSPIASSMSPTVPSSDRITDRAPAAPKSNPFGSATAVDTASKLEKIAITEPPSKLEKNAIAEPSSKPEENAIAEPINGPDSVSASEKSPCVIPSEKIIDENGGPVVEGPKPDALALDKSPLMAKSERKEKVKREPEIINSRAAAFGASSGIEGAKSEVCCFCYDGTYYTCRGISIVQMTNVSVVVFLTARHPTLAAKINGLSRDRHWL
jgi:hypothetical protein